MSPLFAWTASAQTRVSDNASFAYLADPRHAGEWFAAVTVGTIPPGSPHPGQTWRFEAGGPRGKPMPQDILLAVYDPPRRFVWQTARPRLGTTLVWELLCAPDAPSGTTLTLRTQWRVTALGWPLALAAVFIGRHSLPARAQRTVERAREAVEAAFPAPPGGPARAQEASARGTPSIRSRTSGRQRRVR